MVRKFDEDLYSAQAAKKNIGKRFWVRYKDELLALARERSKTDITESIHASWDRFWRFPSWTDRRIDWALALYDHGDWPDLERTEKNTPPRKPPKPKQNNQAHATAGNDSNKPQIEKKCSNCYLANNPDRCGHGMFGPCDDWRLETKHEDYWPTWDDMKRAEQEDYRSRYREV